MFTPPSNIDEEILYPGKIEEATTSASSSHTPYKRNSRPLQSTNVQEQVKVSKRRNDSDDEKESSKPNKKRRRK